MFYEIEEKRGGEEEEGKCVGGGRGKGVSSIQNLEQLN